MRTSSRGRLAETAVARVGASAALSLAIATACSGKVEDTGNGGLGVSMGDTGGAGSTVASGGTTSTLGGTAGSMAAPIPVPTVTGTTPTTPPPVYPPPTPPMPVDGGVEDPAAHGDASAVGTDAGAAVLDAAASGEATACDGTGADAPCLAPGALCWNDPGELVPCADVYDPLCTCMTGTCECWGLWGMDGPPYPNSSATTCDSTEDTTTCVTTGALCWSVNADVADPCANYPAPVCDCDDSPCRCWAEPRSRYQ